MFSDWRDRKKKKEEKKKTQNLSFLYVVAVHRKGELEN